MIGSGTMRNTKKQTTSFKATIFNLNQSDLGYFDSGNCFDIVMCRSFCRPQSNLNPWPNVFSGTSGTWIFTLFFSSMISLALMEFNLKLQFDSITANPDIVCRPSSFEIWSHVRMLNPFIFLSSFLLVFYGVFISRRFDKYPLCFYILMASSQACFILICLFYWPPDNLSGTIIRENEQTNVLFRPLYSRSQSMVVPIFVSHAPIRPNELKLDEYGVSSFYRECLSIPVSNICASLDQSRLRGILYAFQCQVASQRGSELLDTYFESIETYSDNVIAYGFAFACLLLPSVALTLYRRFSIFPNQQRVRIAVR